MKVGIEISGKVRSDARCGEQFPLGDGSPSECDGTSEYPCCSSHGFCGLGPEHCSCPGCVDFRSGEGVGETEAETPPEATILFETSSFIPMPSFFPLVIPLFRGNVRTDRRCGPEFLLPNGKPSECDPTSDNPCCSQWGYCGPGADHCSCSTCKDYRTPEIIGALHSHSELHG